MPTYKLTYFAAPGRAEAIRLAFVLGGIEFEDFHISFQELTSLKESGAIKWGTIPTLEVTDESGKTTVIGQSLAALRLVARQGGLYPTDPIQAARVDEVLCVTEDFFHMVSPTMRADPIKKAAMRKELAEKKFPPIFARLEKCFEENGSNGWLVGESVTAADLAVLVFVVWIRKGGLDGVPATLFDNYPQTKGLQEKIHALPAVAEYYASKK
ncbi:unnamed protein product [Discosporangium mesarthrocarpum]